MTALWGWWLLGVVGGVVGGMFLGASIAQRFLLLGREERDRYRELDPEDTAGRLPSEEVEDDEPTGRHAIRWVESTQRFEAVPGPVGGDR